MNLRSTLIHLPVNSLLAAELPDVEVLYVHRLNDNVVEVIYQEEE